jgi:hypothetical protein
VEKATPNRQVQAIGPFGCHTVHIGALLNKFSSKAIGRCADRNKLWIVCEEAIAKGQKKPCFDGFSGDAQAVGAIRGYVGKARGECGFEGVSPIHRVRVTTIKNLK